MDTNTSLPVSAHIPNSAHITARIPAGHTTPHGPPPSGMAHHKVPRPSIDPVSTHAPRSTLYTSSKFHPLSMHLPLIWFDCAFDQLKNSNTKCMPNYSNKIYVLFFFGNFSYYFLYVSYVQLHHCMCRIRLLPLDCLPRTLW